MLRHKLNIFKPFLHLSIFSFCFLGIVGLQSQQYKKTVSTVGLDNYLQKEKEQQRLIDLQKNLPSFGFDNLIADWTFLNFVQYFGDKPARDTIGYALVPEYFQAISDRDPRFSKAYLTLSSANSVYAGKPEETVVLMERVLQSISPETNEDIPILWSYKGMDELLFLGNTEAAKKSYERSVLFAQQQNTDLGDKLAITNLKTALFLSSAPDTKKAQIAAWSMILPNIQNYRHRQEIIEKINRLEQEISDLNPH
jgi:tetratricopeptide (TPR) repeat protein